MTCQGFGSRSDRPKRRDFITLLGGTVIAWPLAAHAQPSGKTYRIGFLELYLKVGDGMKG